MAASRELSIYLRDHMSGSVLGRDLARRAAGANEGSDYGEELARIAAEIDEDRDALATVMSLLGVSRNPVKEAGAWAGEKLGRLKLNGRLTGYSPLSRLVELEGLMLGVSGKAGLWTALKESGALEAHRSEIDLDLLIERAASQRDRLEAMRRRAAREALVDPGPEPVAGEGAPRAT